MGPDHLPVPPALLPAGDLSVVRNRTFDEIAIGDTVAILRNDILGVLALLGIDKRARSCVLFGGHATAKRLPAGGD
jgi:hypothetical protein